MGLGTQTFTYNNVGQVLGFVGALMTITTVDVIGRRFWLITGTGLLVLWDCLGAGLGSKANRTPAENHATIASLLLINFSTKISVSTLNCELPALKSLSSVLASALSICEILTSL